MEKIRRLLRRNPAVSPREVEVISVHIPETVGTAFRNLLKEVYGNNRVIRLDMEPGNTTVKINTEPWTNAQLPIDIRVVHGHFNAAELKNRFKLPEKARMITWLRDPVERVISNYFYLQKRLTEELNEADKGIGILSKMQRSLMEYARAEINRNRQSKHLAGHQLADFAFVGIQEHYAEDVADLAKFFFWQNEITITQQNVTGTRQEVSQIDRAEIAALNAEDVALYEEGLAIRAARKQQLKLELISIHIPKTAGTSFFQSLEKAYGADLSSNFKRLNYQYMVNCYGSIQASLNGNIKVIHGHLYYQEVADLHQQMNAKIICWLRNPIDRVISNFHFFKSNLTPPIRKIRDYHLNVHRKNEDLLTFARYDENRNVMCQFLSGIELEELFFFGFLETYDTDLRRLSKLLGWPEAYTTKLNIGNKKAYRALKITPAMRQELEALNAEDIKLYQRAKALRS